MIQIDFNREEKIKILKSQGLKVKSVVEKFPSKWGGDEYKKMVDYVVDKDDVYTVSPLDIDAGSDYYINESVKAIMKSKLMKFFLAL